MLTEQDPMNTPAVPGTEKREYESPDGTTRTVDLYRPKRSPSGSSSKFHVYVENPDTGNVNKVGFGDPNMEIKRDDIDNLRNFRNRFSCNDYDPETDKHKPGFWSCVFWRSDLTVQDLLSME